MTAAITCAIIAGLIHVSIFVMESLLWGSKRVNRVFRATPEVAKINQPFAYNQGFYNLFLAAGAIGGSILALVSPSDVATTLMLYATGSMLGAALVLLSSSRQMWRAALIQGLPPLLAIGAWLAA